MVGLFEQWRRTKKYRKHILKKVIIDLHFNEWNKYLTPSQNMTYYLVAKPLLAITAVRLFLVVCHQVCTHLRRDFVSLLFADPLQVIKVLRLTFGNSNLQLPPQIFYGLRSGDWLGHSRTLMCFFLSHAFVDLAMCFGSLSCWNTHPRPIFNALAGFNALALTVHGPVHRPFDAVQMSCPLSRKNPTKHNVSTSMFDGGDGVLVWNLIDWLLLWTGCLLYR